MAVGYGRDFFCADFSINGCSLENKANFIHEFTHVYQFQNDDKYRRDKKNSFSFDVRPAYDFVLDNDTLMSDFNTEQQASIIEDFSREFIFGKGDCMTPQGDEKILLRDFVFASFPQTKISCETDAWAKYRKPKTTLSYTRS